MELLTLKAKSHKGKNRLAEAQRRLPKWGGKTWRVVQKKMNVLFDSRQGPWAHVIPDTDENTDWCSRWVNLRDDDNFTVTANVESEGAARLHAPLPSTDGLGLGGSEGSGT